MLGSKPRIHEILENTDHEPVIHVIKLGKNYFKNGIFLNVSEKSILVPINVVSLNLSNSAFLSLIYKMRNFSSSLKVSFIEN